MERLEKLRALFCEHFGDAENTTLFSAPGRTEICGNHTDHNNGLVLCAAVDLTVSAFVRKTSGRRIRLYSQGFEPCDIDLEAESAENNSVENALVYGVSDAFKNRGLPTGGFDAAAISDVPPGSGLSSSAAFEVLLCRIFDNLFGDGRLSSIEIAKIGRHCENNFMRKPSGLLDQCACAVGNLSLIDFADSEDPSITPIYYDFEESGHDIIITGPIGSHADLTDSYSAITREMKLVAEYFGKRVLREIEEQDFYSALPALYQILPCRAILRAAHYFEENKRVLNCANALRQGDIEAFLENVNASGRSSYMYLQNVATDNSQGLGLALSISERALNGRGACRVHGGGFAGTIQAFVPKDLSECYIDALESVFGDGACMKVRVQNG
jgi:galactokinase